MAEPMTGGCACGRLRYTATIEDDDAYLCQCLRPSNQLQPLMAEEAPREVIAEVQGFFA